MSTKTKTHKTMKLPDNLPPLPPVPAGYDAWEYRPNFKSNGPVGAPFGVYDKVVRIFDWNRTADHLGNPEDEAFGNCDHYIVAVKHPAPSKKKAVSNADKVDTALRMVAESRPQMNKLNREQRQELEASARATISGAKKQPKAMAVKAVRMWTQKEDMDDVNFSPVFMSRTSSVKGDMPYAVLDISDTDALVEQAAWASADTTFTPSASIEHHRTYARAMLQSLGIIPARKAKK